MIIGTDDPIAVAAVGAIHAGDVAALQRLLEHHPELATAALGGADGGDDGAAGMTRTLLHVATDWPGHFPNGAETVATLVGAGADVNARFTGSHSETPLHWAASSDDVAVLDALLDAGADIEARGAVIGGGTPMADATAFGQWNAARRLLERGARTTMWESAALGLLDRVDGHFQQDPPPSTEDATAALWGACHGGHREVAEYLLDRGADVNWVGWDDLTPLDVARRSNADQLVAWLLSVGAEPRGS
jgi:ankyrin repeat protein